MDPEQEAQGHLHRLRQDDARRRRPKEGGQEVRRPKRSGKEAEVIQVTDMVRMISPIVKRGSRVKTGKGFSLGELKEVELNPGEARHLGVPVDQRRSTSYPENVESLKGWVATARKERFRTPKVKQSSK
ncbi:ribosomal protein L13e, partial [Candidatus Bathyarchaeota archaeon]|nr:ribosomal protein L13e [Candidatus Bathyarchaeota archaeon]